MGPPIEEPCQRPPVAITTFSALKMISIGVAFVSRYRIRRKRGRAGARFWLLSRLFGWRRFRQREARSGSGRVRPDRDHAKACHPRKCPSKGKSHLDAKNRLINTETLAAVDGHGGYGPSECHPIRPAFRSSRQFAGAPMSECVLRADTKPYLAALVHARDVSCRPILLKNSDFRLDHNSRDRAALTRNFC
jgi:hypothetical protein